MESKDLTFVGDKIMKQIKIFMVLLVGLIASGALASQNVEPKWKLTPEEKQKVQAALERAEKKLEKKFGLIINPSTKTEIVEDLEMDDYSADDPECDLELEELQRIVSNYMRRFKEEQKNFWGPEEK